MRSRKPILFADFDGVFTRVPEDGETLRTRDRFLPEALARFDRLVELGRPRVVVSSTWRIMPPPPPGRPPYNAVAMLNGWLREAGSKTAVEGVTPIHADCKTAEDVERVRGGEIAHWLSQNAAPGTPWAALDDMPLQGCERLVLIRNGICLADEDATRAFDLLQPIGDEDVRFLRELGAGWVPLCFLRWRSPEARRARAGLLARGLVEVSGRGKNRALRVTVAGAALIA